LWIVEDDPGMAWLMMVSAIETAADHWRTTSTDDPVKLLYSHKEEWAKRLEATGDPSLLDYFAKEWKSLIKAMDKFISFLLEFLPPPPAIRPSPSLQHSWDKESLKKSLRVIYDHRSSALHAGIPIPPPMQMQSHIFDGAPAEVVPGLYSEWAGNFWPQS